MGPVDVASPATPRAADAVYAENEALRGDLAMLQVKFDELSRLNADRQMVGTIRSLCEPATVTGYDASGVRETLAVSGVDEAAVDRPVVHGTNLVGRVQTAGLTGGTVRLVTDPGFALTAELGRYETDAGGRVTLRRAPGLRPLVQGVGHGAMAIRTAITMQQVTDLHLAVGDVVVLSDKGWPPNVQGLTVGKITAINHQSAAPIFADLRVEPDANLSRLTEVMVVVRG